MSKDLRQKDILHKQDLIWSCRGTSLGYLVDEILTFIAISIFYFSLYYLLL